MKTQKFFLWVVIVLLLIESPLYAAKVVLRITKWSEDRILEQYRDYPGSYPVTQEKLSMITFSGAPHNCVRSDGTRMFDTTIAAHEDGSGENSDGTFSGDDVVGALRRYEDVGLTVDHVSIYREDWLMRGTTGGPWAEDCRILSVQELADIRTAIANSNLKCKDTVKVLQLLGPRVNSTTVKDNRGDTWFDCIQNPTLMAHLMNFDGIGTECHVGDYSTEWESDGPSTLDAMAAITKWAQDNGKLAHVFMGGTAGSYRQPIRTRLTYEYLWDEMDALGVDKKSDHLIYFRQGARSLNQGNDPSDPLIRDHTPEDENTLTAQIKELIGHVWTPDEPEDFPPLVAHWEFDEGAGTVAADSSGNGFTGTLLNGVTWRSDAFRGSHVSFDGDNDRISTTLRYALSSSDDFTWAWWANKQTPAGTDNGAIMVGNRYGGTGAENYEFIKFTPIETQFANTSTIAAIERYNYVDIPQNQWHHYAMVKTGTSCQWYVDGVAEGGPVTINYHESSAIPFLIGGDDDGSGTKVNEHFKGFIDDVRVYSYALTVSELEALSFVELPSPDIVRDYLIDLADFSALAANWLDEDCYSSGFCNGCDLNADQIVDQGDLLLLVQQWLSPVDLPLVTLVDDFESYAVDTVMNNQTSPGPLGGLWDSDDEGTWHSTRAGKVILDGTNQVVYQEYRSSGRRTLCVNGLTDPIDEGEMGILFFRFKALATTNPISWYAGVHELTGSDPLTVSSADETSKLVAGFHAVSADGSAFDIKTVDDSIALQTGFSQEQWYSVWMVIDHDLNTFDLYIEAAADGSGEAGDLPATAVGSDLPFEISTTNSLTGGLWHQAGGNSANMIFDEVAWSGAYSTP